MDMLIGKQRALHLGILPANLFELQLQFSIRGNIIFWITKQFENPKLKQMLKFRYILIVVLHIGHLSIMHVSITTLN